MTAPPPDQLLSQIKDIKGLDAISPWPPAPVWWAIAALAILLPTLAVIIYLRRRAYERSWKGDARRTLDALAAELAPASARAVASELSAVLRRIAMQRFSRKACAGLEGRAWLAFLQKNDPKGFDWASHGRLLTEIPYAPPNMAPPPEKVRALIDAVKPWVA